MSVYNFQQYLNLPVYERNRNSKPLDAIIRSYYDVRQDTRWSNLYESERIKLRKKAKLESLRNYKEEIFKVLKKPIVQDRDEDIVDRTFNRMRARGEDEDEEYEEEEEYVDKEENEQEEENQQHKRGAAFENDKYISIPKKLKVRELTNEEEFEDGEKLFGAERHSYKRNKIDKSLLRHSRSNYHTSAHKLINEFLESEESLDQFPSEETEEITKEEIIKRLNDNLPDSHLKDVLYCEKNIHFFSDLLNTDPEIMTTLPKKLQSRPLVLDYWYYIRNQREMIKNQYLKQRELKKQRKGDGIFGFYYLYDKEK